jgi:membrane-associated phospholipid phosphatase
MNNRLASLVAVLVVVCTVLALVLSSHHVLSDVFGGLGLVLVIFAIYRFRKAAKGS